MCFCLFELNFPWLYITLTMLTPLFMVGFNKSQGANSKKKPAFLQVIHDCQMPVFIHMISKHPVSATMC